MREAWSNRNGGKKVPDTIDAGHLWILPSDIHLSGAEIELSHKIGRETRLQEALLPIADEFDYIIIDTPPVLVVPDARIIAKHADAVLFGVKWDATSKTQVQDALRMFESVGQKVSGLVLGQISPDGMKRYGYGGRYGSYAAYGAKYYNN